MTHAEMLAALAPPRLPTAFAAPSLPDLLVLAGIGLALGALVGAAVLPLTRRRPARARLRLAQLRALPVPERLLVLARLLGRLPASLRAAAYGAAPPPSDRAIERAARRVRPWLR